MDGDEREGTVLRQLMHVMYDCTYQDEIKNGKSSTSCAKIQNPRNDPVAWWVFKPTSKSAYIFLNLVLWYSCLINIGT